SAPPHSRDGGSARRHACPPLPPSGGFFPPTRIPSPAPSRGAPPPPASPPLPTRGPPPHRPPHPPPPPPTPTAQRVHSLPHAPRPSAQPSRSPPGDDPGLHCACPRPCSRAAPPHPVWDGQPEWRPATGGLWCRLPSSAIRPT